MSHYPNFGIPAVYVDPSIVSFTATPALAELGSTVDSVVLRWDIAKQPLSLIVDGATLPLNTLLVTKEGPFTTNQSWSMKAGDAEETLTAKTTLQFVNKLYSGFVTSAPTNSAGILALENSTLSTTRQSSAQIGAPAGKVWCYAYPKRLGTVKIAREIPSGVWVPTTLTQSMVSGTDYTVSVVSFTNASGYTEDYNVVTFSNPQPDNTVLTFG